jgi:hypothetical protein
MTRARDVANLIGSGNYSSTTFTATAGQTVFSIAHTQNFVQVFMNGLLLDLTVDYTSNGSAVTLTSGAAAGDEIEVVAYNTFSVGDALNQAAADTRYVNASGDTMTGTLNTTGLNVTQTGSTTAKVGATGTSGDNDGTLIISNGGSGDGMLRFDYETNTDRARIGVTTSGQDLKFFTAGNNERVKIDSSGRVTMPYQPAFFARHTTATTYNNAYVVNWNSITYNVGNHFVGSTGTFTAPVSGVYQLNSMLGNNYANGNGNYTVKLNGADYAGLIWDPYTGQTAWSTSILVGQMKLATNDTVRIYCNSTGHPDNSSWTSWSMSLLG